MRTETDPAGREWIVLDREEKMMGFLLGCVEGLAEAEGVCYLDMFDRLEKSDMTEGHILRNYDVIHTQSWEHIIEELLDMLHRREDKLALCN